MDSSAIYLGAWSDFVAEGDLRMRLAAHERRAFLADLVPAMMQWKWCDSVTGETLAPALDEPPELPELSRWMPTDSNITWDDIPDVDIHNEEMSALCLRDSDCVLVYQYA
jgi:hypothetical protein